MPPKLAIRAAHLKTLGWVLVFFVPFAGLVYEPLDSDYAASLTADTARSAYLAIIVGTAAAFRTAALRRGGILDRGPVRTPVTILLDALWPLLALAVVLQLAVVLVGVVLTGGGISAGILGVNLVVLVAQIVLAGGAGLLLRARWAALGLAVFWFAWLLLPLWAALPLVNQLNGQFIGCCGVAETWSRPAAWASLAVGVAVLGGVVLAVSLPGRPVAVAVAVPLVAASVAALLLPDATRWGASQPRPDDTRCAGTAPRICLRPEHVDALPEVRAALEDLKQDWAPFGVTFPATFSEAGGPGRVRFQYGPDHDRSLVRQTAAINAVPSVEHCYRDPLPPDNDRALVAAVDHLTLWLQRLADVPGYSADDALTDPANAGEVDRVTGRPADEQAAWYEDEVAMIRSCGGRDV